MMGKVPILMSEEFWAKSPFSVARHTGCIKIDGREYMIVDKRGRDIYECTYEAQCVGRDNAIEAGEPADLCRTDFIPLYKKLGRDKFVRFLKENPDIEDVKTARQRLKTWE